MSRVCKASPLNLFYVCCSAIECAQLALGSMASLTDVAIVDVCPASIDLPSRCKTHVFGQHKILATCTPSFNSAVFCTGGPKLMPRGICLLINMQGATWELHRSCCVSSTCQLRGGTKQSQVVQAKRSSQVVRSCKDCCHCVAPGNGVRLLREQVSWPRCACLPRRRS